MNWGQKVVVSDGPAVGQFNQKKPMLQSLRRELVVSCRLCRS